MFVMLYVTRIILRTLGASDFGIYDVVGGAISMLGFLNTSMASTVQRFLNNAQGQNNSKLQLKVFNIGVIFHFSIAVIMIFALAILYFILFNGVLNIPAERVYAAKIVYLCLIVSTFFNIITVPYDASINAHEDFLTYSIIGIIDIILKLIVAIAIIYCSNDKLVLYAFLMMIVPISSYIMMKIWCIKHYKECKIAIRKYYDKIVAKRMLSFSGWALLGSSSNLVGNYGNSIVLNHFFGTVLNAVTGIANQTQGMLQVLSAGMLRSLNPIIYKSGVNSPQKLMLYSFMGCKYSFLLLAIFAIPVMIETPFLLQIWLGDVPKWAVLFVRLQLLRCLLEQLTSTFNKSLESVGKIKELNIYTFALNLMPILVLSILYSIGCAPYWYFIVAIFFMVILTSLMKIHYCIMYCGLNINTFMRLVLLPCCMCSLIPTFIIGILKNIFLLDNFFSSIMILLMAFVLVVITTILFLSNYEKQVLIEFIRNSINNKGL